MSVNFTPKLVLNTDQLPPEQQAKVDSLRTDEKIVGIFLMFNTKRETEEAFYVEMRGNEYKKDFYAMRLEDDALVGRVEAFLYRERNEQGIFGNPANDMCVSDSPDFCGMFHRYGDTPFASKIIVDKFYTAADHPLSHKNKFSVSCDYKGIGAHLIYAIQKVFHGQFGGRMEVQAAYSSHGFYYKMGFRTMSPEWNTKIEQCMQEKTDTSHLMSVYMLLNEEAAQSWERLCGDADETSESENAQTC